MNKSLIKLLFLSLFISFSWAELDCPADEAVHVDTRTMLPDGSPNPTYGQEIVTGLCGCLGFVNGAIIDGNEITFIVRMVDNEPIRGIELDIYHDNSDLVYSGVDKGNKLEDLTDSEGTPRTMTLLGNYLEDRLKVLAYSTSQAQTAGNGEEGDLVHITYELVDGAEFPSEVTFYLGLANLPGTSANPELLNVVCGYPDENSQVVVSTSSLANDDLTALPVKFALNQNYPNPFNPSTQITFDVPVSTDIIQLSIYNVLGQNVNTLVNSVMSAGTHTIEWNATDLSGSPVASGIYFYELRSGSFTERKKMLLIR